MLQWQRWRTTTEPATCKPQPVWSGLSRWMCWPELDGARGCAGLGAQALAPLQESERTQGAGGRDSMPLTGGVCLHCGHWVRVSFISGEPQSHTVWSAASPWPGAGEGGGEGGPQGRSPYRVHRPGETSLSPSCRPQLSCSLSLLPHALSACPRALCHVPVWCPPAPGHCPVCKWPLWLES